MTRAAGCRKGRGPARWTSSWARSGHAKGVIPSIEGFTSDELFAQIPQASPRDGVVRLIPRPRRPGSLEVDSANPLELRRQHERQHGADSIKHTPLSVAEILLHELRVHQGGGMQHIHREM